MFVLLLVALKLTIPNEKQAPAFDGLHICGYSEVLAIAFYHILLQLTPPHIPQDPNPYDK